MAQTKNNIPQIRFKGFYDEWEDIILADVCDFSKGKGYSKSDLTEKGVPIVLYGRLYTKYQTEILDVDTFVNVKENAVLSQGNEIVIPASGETAEDISRASVIKKKGIILGGDLNVLKLNNNFNSTFLALSISNGNVQKELSKKAQGKSVVHIHNSDIRELCVSFPIDSQEQNLIVSFFRTLDTLITTRQKKLESLKNLKKACLVKMFPQNGSKVPEIRFKGFSGEWEEKKLGEISKIVKGEQLNVKDMTENGTYYVLNGGITPSGYTNSFNTDKNTISISEGGNSCGYVNFNNCKFWSGGHNYTIKHIADFIQNEYLYHYLKNIEPFIMSKRVGSGLPNIQKTALQNIKVIYSSLSEQTAIANYFQNFDKLISTQEQEIEKLQNLKKACLDKMFV